MDRVPPFLISHFSLLIFLLASCSFDYGGQESDKNRPDIVMESVEYVRMRSADPQARFQAERAERYEERRIMELLNFSFEQFGNQGDEVNTFGRAGSGTVEIDSGDIRMDNTVRIEVESEDITIETLWLEWKDNDRLLFGGEEEEVIIQQQNGTTFTGIGFRADARRRTWEFSGSVEGVFVQEDDDEEEESGGGNVETAAEEPPDGRTPGEET
jgi:LPS export ABC transporter protein LptC